MDIAKFSPDGRYIAAANALSNDLCVYDAVSMELISSQSFHIRPLNAIAWSHCGSYIATGGEDCAVVVWRFAHKDGLYLAPKRVLRGHVAPVISLNFNPKGTILASGGMDECIYMWDVLQKIPHKRLFVHNEPIFAVQFSYDGELLMTASFEGYVRIWSVKDGMVLRTLHDAPAMGKITAATLSPNSKYVLINYWSGRIQLVDIVDGKVLRKVECPRKEGEMEIRSMVFIRPNHFLVATPGGIIKYDIDKDEGEYITTNAARYVDYNMNTGAGLQAGPKLELINV